MFISLLVAGGLWATTGCSNKKPSVVEPVTVQPARDIPTLLRGTVGAEASFSGVEPVLVSGYGLVVGLNGTGGDVLPDSIRTTMEREMGLLGIGKAGDYRGTAIDGVTPQQLLRDKSVAVVLVQAAIPPGSPAGANFDCYVRAINASSLEGGNLWTTELRIGDASTFGQVQTRGLARARGPVFINPFSEPGREDTGVSRLVGRVLDGGVVTNPLQIGMTLNTPSFQLVRSVTSAINSRFPEQPGDGGPVARGRGGPNASTGSGGSIALRVPAQYRRKPGEFLQILRHIRIDQNVPEQYARRYVDGVISEPVMAESVAWSLEALGQKSLPFARELYDYAELAPRMAGLRAGARLNDPRAVPALTSLANGPRGPVRSAAIELLGRIDGGPTVDVTLRELLNGEDFITRIAAYEALASRSERLQYNRLSASQRSNRERNAPRYSPSQLEILSEMAFPGNTMQGVERRLVEDKFLLDIVPYGEPLIYIAQQGRPRIVLFGAKQALVVPSVMSAWSGRLMLTTDAATNAVRVYYLAPGADRALVQQARGTLPEMVAFLAKKPSATDARPGLNLSYSEVVGALHEMFKAGVTQAAFATETDKLKSELLAAASSFGVAERPETPEDKEVIILNKPAVMEPSAVPQGSEGDKPTIVPIGPATPKK